MLACEWKCPLMRPGIASLPAASITLAPSAWKVRPNRRDLVAFDQNVGACVFAVLRVERQDARVADKGLHGVPVKRLPQRAPRSVLTPARRSASHTPMEVVS